MDFLTDYQARKWYPFIKGPDFNKFKQVNGKEASKKDS
jgi:hypothetical protein